MQKNNTSDFDLVIHHRGGDFIRNGIKTLNIDYYDKIALHFNLILVVTNDIVDAKKVFENSKYKYKKISNKDPMLDFCILISAKNLVISNSTFSWWAGELSDADNIYEPNGDFDAIRELRKLCKSPDPVCLA